MSEYAEKYLIDPDPEWIRPAKFPDGRWHGYCLSGPEDGISCPYGDNFIPARIDGIWYWVKKDKYENL